MAETPSPTAPAGALTKEGAVLYGSAKAEAPRPPKQESPIVSGVRKAVDKWLERIGPKGVENRFIKAHENVLATLNSDQRKEVFAKGAEKWRKWGKTFGITATIIDSGLSIYGFGLSFFGMLNPEKGAQVYLDIIKRSLQLSLEDNPNMAPGTVLDLINQNHFDIPTIQETTTTAGLIDHLQLKNTSIRGVGTKVALMPGIFSAIFAFGIGPGHALAHIAGFGAEQIGKMKARGQNYVDSGKAAEHAAKVGNALGKAATETAKYVAEHPDEIRKTVEAVSKAKRENAESAQKIAQAKQKAADAKLDAEYQDWVMHHPDKAYYEQSGQPYPSKAEYVDMKAREAAAKQANKEVEERGVAKK